MTGHHKKKQNLNLWFGVPITLLVLALYFYWFRIANRSIVFLVDHDMGPFGDSTAPFSFITRSRYWMTGLVASGAVMVLYLAANITLRLFSRTYMPPAWFKVWIIPAVCIVVGIPLITMTTTNAPALPPAFTLWVTAVALSGLVFALLPGTYGVKHPFETILLAVDGAGLSFILTGAAAIEEFPGWLERGARHFVTLSVVIIFAGLVITLGMVGLRFIMKWRNVTASRLFLAGICLTYPGLSILHHVLFSDGYFYITDSDNFFTRNILLQGAIWILTALYCAGLYRLRSKLETLRKDR